MPHAEKTSTPCNIDEDGNLTYPTSPAETLTSEIMGLPTKGGSPWTNHTQASSSAVKATQPRQRHRSQMPKQSFLDTNSNENVLDNSQGDCMQHFRNRDPLLPAPHDDLEHFDESRPNQVHAQDGDQMDENYPVPPPSGQKVLLSMTDDGEDQELPPDADKSPILKPTEPASSRQRKMSDASDMHAPSEAKGVVSYRQKEMSDTPTTEECPKKKGKLQFSSTAPSVTDPVDEKPLQNIPRNMWKESGKSSETANHAKTVALRRKPAVNSNSKVRLSALDLEGDQQSEDPFDQANIPPSRGISPGPTRKRTKQAPKKQSIAKTTKLSPPKKTTSPRNKGPVAKSSKSSPQGRPSVRPRQKAKPSAAEVVPKLVATGAGEDIASDGQTPNEPDHPTLNDFPKKAPSAKAPAPTRTAKTSRGHTSVPKNAVILISSATESEASDTEESDDDEYVEESSSRVVQGNNQPPKTRNAVTRSRGMRGLHADSNRSSATLKRKDNPTGNQEVKVVENDLKSKTSSNKSNKRMVQSYVPETEAAVEIHHKTTTIADTLAPCPTPAKSIATGKRDPIPNKQSSPAETGETSSAIKPGVRQARQAKTTHLLVTAFAGPSENHSSQAKLTRQYKADQPQNELKISEAKQSRMPTKHTESLVDASPEEARDERERRTDEVKSKDRKANIIAFGTDGPKNTGKSRKRAGACGNQPEQQDSNNSSGANTSKSAMTKQIPIENNGHVLKKDQSKFHTAGSSENPLAQDAHTWQSSSQATDLQSAIPSAVDLPSTPEEKRLEGSHALQNISAESTRKPSAVLEEDEYDATLLHAQVTMGRDPSLRQTSSEVAILNDEEYAGADYEECVTDIQSGNEPIDELDGPVKPDSLEKPDGLEDLVSVSQVHNSAMTSNLRGQYNSGFCNILERSAPDEGAMQSILPDSTQFKPQSLVDIQADHGLHQIALDRKATVESAYSSDRPESHGRAIAPKYHTKTQQSAVAKQPSVTAGRPSVNQLFVPNPQSLLNNQPPASQKVAPEQKSLLRSQPVWKQRSTTSQQPMRSMDPFNNEQSERHDTTRDLQAPLLQKTTHHQLPTLKNFTQPGVGMKSAKRYMQDLSTNLQKPSKRTKFDGPEPSKGPPVSTSYNQFCVPANDSSSDDVFNADGVTHKSGIAPDVVNQLRGIKSAKCPAPSDLETQRPTSDYSDKMFAPARPRPSTRIFANSAHSHPMQNESQGTIRFESSDDTGVLGLWRRGMSRRHEVLPVVKHKEPEVIASSKPYEGVEDAMHRIVDGVLRALRSKEFELHEVVNDYGVGGGRIVDSIAATHAEEREKLVEDRENKRLDYVRICEEARRQINSIDTRLQAMDFGKSLGRNTESPPTI